MANDNNDSIEQLPDFGDAPGTHGELVELPLRQREDLSSFARDLLHKLDDVA
ncbi:Uncharacterised protein (plasmid) [Tsukamurella tyrosinosolvens]|uniref:Uncharacterized protein n=1 Tax=Tsukamurella tyrosinosolvens TaxID=57704 RepID=A0A1H4VAC5_TSUTY|nr:hypothetical protein [Tsukamurella tyrosinosolvens]SEC77875.1 hypothetical protein SAMN04489793_3182 [Tsukamurella tyrosinosolvens]VEH90610.1 Uncharacterised protein [Tsukamurella tyrosinosolvens]